jgi:hypothetical protein
LKDKTGGKKRSSNQADGKKTQRAKLTEDDGICQMCKVSYGDPCDVKKDEEWLACLQCRSWFHQTCAEYSGVIDDADGFICKNCIA